MVIISMMMRTVRNHIILRLRSYIAHTFRDNAVIERLCYAEDGCTYPELENHWQKC